MKYLLAVAALFALSAIAYGAEPAKAPPGMTAVPTIPFGAPPIQGSCPNGVCGTVVQTVRSAFSPTAAGAVPATPQTRRKFAPLRRLLGFPVD